MHSSDAAGGAAPRVTEHDLSPEEWTQIVEATAWEFVEVLGGDVPQIREAGLISFAGEIDQKLNSLVPSEHTEEQLGIVAWNLTATLAETMRQLWGCQWRWGFSPQYPAQQMLVLDGWRAMPGTRPQPVEPSSVVKAELQHTPPSYWKMINAIEALAEVRVFRGEEWKSAEH